MVKLWLGTFLTHQLYFAITGNGQVDLSDADVTTLNEAIKTAGFEDVLVPDHAPKFVVGEIVDLVPHPDSDHLNIAQVKISEDETIQIVAGAPNARLGLKTIVALPQDCHDAERCFDLCRPTSWRR